TDVTFPPSVLTTNTSLLVWSIVGDLGVATDYQSLCYWSITYPRMLNFSGLTNFDIRVPNSTESMIRLDFSNISSTNPIALSLGSNPQRLSIVNDGGTFKAL